MATPLLWTMQEDTVGALGLAINTCAEGGAHPEAVLRIRELLTRARELWHTMPGLDDDRQRFQVRRLAFRLVQIAEIETVTATG
jgi:hypothetical protein